MDSKQAAKLLREILRDVGYADGVARTDDFAGLRQVDAKVRSMSTRPFFTAA